MKRAYDFLEHYNKIFKNLIDIKPDIRFSIYIDKIKQEILIHKIMIEELETKKKQKLYKSKILENIESKMKCKVNLEELSDLNLEKKIYPWGYIKNKI